MQNRPQATFQSIKRKDSQVDVEMSSELQVPDSNVTGLNTIGTHVSYVDGFAKERMIANVEEFSLNVGWSVKSSESYEKKRSF